jgi:hypothetical protein
MSRAGSSVLCGGVDGYMADYNIHSVYAFYMHQRVTPTAPPSRTRCYNSSWRHKSASTAQYESECDVRPWPVIGAGPAKSLRDMPCQPYHPPIRLTRVWAEKTDESTCILWLEYRSFGEE